MSKESKKHSDPFDPENLRIKTDFTSTVGVKKIYTHIPVRKPDRQWFSRVHPGEDFRIEAAVIDWQEDKEFYLVPPYLCAEFPAEVKPMALFTGINRQGVLFVWPVKLPQEDGRHGNWGASMLEAVRIAQTRWVRCSSNMSAGCYDVAEAAGVLPDPVWPELSFHEILKIAFKDKYIDNLEHPIIQKLAGRI